MQNELTLEVALRTTKMQSTYSFLTKKRWGHRRHRDYRLQLDVREVAPHSQDGLMNRYVQLNA